MKKGIVTFCGHRDAIFYYNYSVNNVEEDLEQVILKLFYDYDYITFYVGDQGVFDYYAREIIKKLRKKNNLPCELVYVAPYLPSVAGKDEYFDDTIFPPLENVPKRFCIARRNNWMVEQADVLVSYVIHDWGGAWNTLDYAMHRLKTHGKPKVINLSGNADALLF